MLLFCNSLPFLIDLLVQEKLPIFWQRALPTTAVRDRGKQQKKAHNHVHLWGLCHLAQTTFPRCIHMVLPRKYVTVIVSVLTLAFVVIVGLGGRF